MKKILTAMAALAMVAGFASCQKENDPVNGSSENGFNKVTVKASMPEASKVTYSENGNNALTPAWEENDKILVINKDNSASMLTVTEINGNVATLEGEAKDGLAHLVYMEGVNTSSWVSNKIEFSYDNQSGDNDMPAVMLADGTISNGSGEFMFNNAGAVIGIYNAKGVPASSAITKVTVTGSNLSKATISINDDALKLAATEKADDAISTAALSNITVTDGTTGALSTPIYIAVPAGAKVAKVTLTVGADTYTYTLAAAKECNANDYLYIKSSEFKSSVTLRLTAEVSSGKNAYFRNTHCCFSPDRKTAYLPTQDGNLVAVDLANHAVKWVWKTTETLSNGSVNVACNPVTGDVYLRNKATALKNDGFFAITPDGNTKWTVNDILPLGNCFAVSSDGAAILACGTSKTLKDANNREFGAFSATDGSQLDRCYQRGSEVSGEGVVNQFMFCNNAQMAIYKTDATYDYIVLYGNELLQFYTYNRTTKKFKAIQMVQPYSTWKSWADACSISPAVSPEGKIFIPSNTKGVIMVIDGSVAEPWNSISWMTIGIKNITGIVFDTDGNMIIGTRDGMTKVSKDKLAGGPSDNPVNPTADAIYVASIGKDVFTHSYPYVSASGDVYAACNNAVATLCGDIYYVPAASTGTCAPVEVYHSETTTSAQSCFCVTDGALIFPTTEPAEIILKTNNGLKMPKTWCGYGGDPCASMNVAFAYGNK